jgi:2-oxoglutarate ferredoxin oxidoreductase subunit beta
MRRNVGLKILLFNNRIYGLTKGQYSPTSEVGKRSPSTPLGSADNPFNPLSVVLGTGCSFVARSVDTDVQHLQDVLKRAAAHKGTAFVEIYQNCNVFNDLAFAHLTDKEVRADRQLVLEAGKPLVFGKDRDRALRMKSNGTPEIVKVGEGPGKIPLAELPVHDESFSNAGYAFMLAQLDSGLGAAAAGVAEPTFPIAMGVLRAVEQPCFETVVRAQEVVARRKAGEACQNIETLWQGDTWVQQ